MTARVVHLEDYRRVDVDNAVLDELPTLTAGVEVRFHPSMPPHIQRLMATLGARISFDPAGHRGRDWADA